MPDDRELKIRFGFVKRSSDDLKYLNNFIGRLSSSNTQHISLEDSINTSSNFINSKNQQSTIKLRYSDSREAHLKFLSVYMVQKNKEEVEKKPKLFGNVSEAEYKDNLADKKFVVTKRSKDGVKKITKSKSRHYKFILSPEKNLSESVLKEYTKCFVARLEQQTGHNYLWQAVVHQDTAHPHVHLLINGTDIKGNDLRSKEFDSNTLRNARKASSEILTHMCGERDKALIEAARNRRVIAERWTEYDEAIKNCMDEIKGYESSFCGRIHRCSGNVQRRLEFLEDRGLARYEGGSYYLKRNYEETLNAMGRYNKFMEASRFVNSGTELKLYRSEAGSVQGKVKYIYSMNDEDVWSNAVVVEDEKNREAWFVPLFNPLNEKLLHKQIRIEPKQNQKGQLTPKISVDNSVSY